MAKDRAHENATWESAPQHDKTPFESFAHETPRLEDHPALRRVDASLGLDHVIGSVNHHAYAKELEAFTKELSRKILSHRYQVAIAARMLLRAPSYAGNDPSIIIGHDVLVMKAWELITNSDRESQFDPCYEAVTDILRPSRIDLNVNGKRFYTALVAARLLDLLCEVDAKRRSELFQQCALAFFACLDGSLDADPRNASIVDRQSFDLLPGLAATELDISLANEAAVPRANIIDPRSLFVSPLWSEVIPSWFETSGDNLPFGWQAFHKRLVDARDRTRFASTWSLADRLRQQLELRYPQLVESRENITALGHDPFENLTLPPIDRTLTIREAISLVRETRPITIEMREQMRVTIEKFLRQLGTLQPDKEQGQIFCDEVNGLLSSFGLALKLDTGERGYGRLEIRSNTSNNTYLMVRHRNDSRSLRNCLSCIEVVLIPF